MLAEVTGKSGGASGTQSRNVVMVETSPTSLLTPGSLLQHNDFQEWLEYEKGVTQSSSNDFGEGP